MSDFLNIDCMEYMKTVPDKYFEICIVDPPYGIGESRKVNSRSEYVKQKNGNILYVPHKYKVKKWDDAIPDKKYFDELTRISKNQIIWGGNYFIEHLKNTRCFISWDKLNNHDNYADCELAWTSFNKNARVLKYMWDGNRYGFIGEIKGVGKKTIRIHPTQKPVALYRWLLQNYAKPGDKIIDTHSGSGSLACACHLEKFDFLAIEKDEDYFKASVERLKTLRSQLTLF
jgi:site-specific DNA-methyltransferase (adenine-specific)